MIPLTKAWKLVVTGRCSGQPQHSHLTCTDARCTSPGLGASTGHSPLAQRLRDVLTDHHPISSQLWYGSRLPLCSLSSVSVTFHRNCPTSLLPGLSPVSVDSRLTGLSGGHCLEWSSLPWLPIPLFPQLHNRVSA